MSDASGIASIDRTLGSTAGTQTATARVKGLTGSPVQFTATATAGNAFEIAASGGGGSHTINSSFPLSAIVRDAHGNPKSGVQVSWAAQMGTGSVDPTQSTTGANGIATTTRMLGPNAGTYTDTAYASGLQGSPVQFTVTAITAPQTADVSLMNIAFNPASVTIVASGQVTWTWNDGALAHNVTFASATGAPSNCGTISSGTCTRTFSTAGAFNYSCTIHPGMDGSVTVVP